MDLRLTPPQMHRQNWAERAIQTGKAHLIASRVGINPNSPLHLWCRLIPQCEKTLNMMRPTHINPKISAVTYLQGTHYFNRLPFDPSGILTVIHKSPQNRESYAPHGLKGWYVGGSPEHYRCFDIWCPDMRRARQGETVQFSPHDHVLPGLSPHENITCSVHELIADLKYTHPESPTATIGNE